jgi:hypothetical protein
MGVKGNFVTKGDFRYAVTHALGTEIFLREKHLAALRALAGYKIRFFRRILGEDNNPFFEYPLIFSQAHDLPPPHLIIDSLRNASMSFADNPAIVERISAVFSPSFGGAA